MNKPKLASALELGFKPYSFLIYRDGNYAVVKNGLTGLELTRDLDHHVAIQRAIDALPAEGGTVLMKEGTFLISDSIILKPYTRLRGVGKHLTVLYLADNVNKTVIKTTEELHWMSPIIEDLMIEGNKANNTAGHGIDIFGSMHGVMKGIEIENCAQHGISLRGTSANMLLGTRLSDVNIEKCNGSAIRMFDWTFDLLAVNCNFGVSGDHQLDLHSSSQMVNCHVWGGTKCGIVIYIQVRVGIINCIIEGNGQHGIWMHDAKDCRVIGNIVQDNSSVLADNDGIALLGTSLRNQIIGNICRDTRTPRKQRYGVNEGDTSNWNLIMGNSIAENQAPLFKVGANTDFIDNIGYVVESTSLSPTFAVDSIGIKSVTMPHYLGITPNPQDCELTLVEVTAVDDYVIGFVKVIGTDATNVYAKVKVTTASGTSGATARLALRVGRKR